MCLVGGEVLRVPISLKRVFLVYKTMRCRLTPFNSLWLDILCCQYHGTKRTTTLEIKKIKTTSEVKTISNKNIFQPRGAGDTC